MPLETFLSLEGVTFSPEENMRRAATEIVTLKQFREILELRGVETPEKSTQGVCPLNRPISVDDAWCTRSGWGGGGTDGSAMCPGLSQVPCGGC